ncbi:transposase [Salana multivorans]
MAAPRKYSVELQLRATRIAMHARKDPESARGAIKRVTDQLGVHPEALRNWVRQAEIDGGVQPGTTTDRAQRLAKLEVRQLRRVNEVADPGSPARSPHRRRTRPGRVGGGAGRPTSAAHTGPPASRGVLPSR